MSTWSGDGPSKRKSRVDASKSSRRDAPPGFPEPQAPTKAACFPAPSTFGIAISSSSSSIWVSLSEILRATLAWLSRVPSLSSRMTFPRASAGLLTRLTGWRTLGGNGCDLGMSLSQPSRWLRCCIASRETPVFRLVSASPTATASVLSASQSTSNAAGMKIIVRCHKKLSIGQNLARLLHYYFVPQGRNPHAGTVTMSDRPQPRRNRLSRIQADVIPTHSGTLGCDAREFPNHQPTPKE